MTLEVFVENNFHIGHQNIIKFLQKQIKAKHIAHAYLFVGPESVGKSQLAKYFARELQGLCLEDKEIENNLCPDIFYIEPNLAEKTFKKSISIKQVHEVQQKLTLTSHSNQFKIAVIVDAECMTEEAQNAFLKTLEEPTKNSVIILTTSSEDKILPTICSRCQKVYLGLVPKKEIFSALEKFPLDREKKENIANLSGGRPGKAILLADKGFYQNYINDLNLINSIIEKDICQRFEQAKSLSERVDLINILNNWSIYFRDLLVLKYDASDELINGWFKDEFLSFYEKHDINDIKNIIGEIRKTTLLLSKNANPRLAMENLLLKI